MCVWRCFVNLKCLYVESNACAATSVVLVVLNSESEVAQSTARWLVQQGEGPGSAGLRASLSCLYSWLCTCTITHGLGDWIMALIKALEVSTFFLLFQSAPDIGHFNTKRIN